MRGQRASGLTLLLLAGCQAAVPPSVVETGSPHQASFARAVSIGERTLFLDCGGNGAPPVLLEAGGGGDSAGWHGVLPELRRFTRACAYDRAGTGRSSAAPRPHTMQQMIDELDALLERAPLQPSYVLVGHSLGGLLVRLYTSQHPDEVSGLVLLDPSTEQQAARLWSQLPPDVMAQFRVGLSQSPDGLDYDSFVAGMAQLQAAERALGHRPLIVLTAMGSRTIEPGVPAEVGERMAREWLAMHAEVSRLSSNSAHLVLDTGHDIARDAPALVVAAIEAVVASARGQRPLTVDPVLAGAHVHGIKAVRAADFGAGFAPRR
jgi:pimeloyl-ACP methyl ester carboxylesterase